MAIKARSRTAKLIASPIASAHETIGVLTPGCRVIGVNKCQFSLIDLVMAVIEQIGPSGLTASGSQINAAFNALRLGSGTPTVKPKAKAARAHGFQFNGFRFGK